jgi:hypothetical protein
MVKLNRRADPRRITSGPRPRAKSDRLGHFWKADLGHFSQALKVICEQRPNTLERRPPSCHHLATQTRCFPCLQTCRLPFWKRFRRMLLPLSCVKGVDSWHDPDITIGPATAVLPFQATGQPIPA